MDQGAERGGGRKRKKEKILAVDEACEVMELQPAPHFQSRTCDSCGGRSRDTRIHTCARAYTHTHAHAHTRTHTHTKQTDTRMHSHTHTVTHTHTADRHSHTCTHTNTHTHTL